MTTPSPNAPILQQILQKVNTIDNRLFNVESNVSTIISNLTTLDKKFNTYVKNESDIQEDLITRNIQSLFSETRGITAVYHRLPLKVFYIPTMNTPFTDFDGCIIQEFNPISIKNKNGKKDLEERKAYIIEAKHGLTKTIIDYKLKQFCTILDIFEGIHNHSIPIRNVDESPFDNMVHSYNLVIFPETIYFIFGSDDIPKEQEELLNRINLGTIDEDWYNEYIIKNLKSHNIVSQILDNRHVSINIKEAFKHANTLNDIRNLFIQNTLSENATNRQRLLEREKLSIKQYTSGVLNLLESFEDVSACYKKLKGRLGLYQFNELKWL